MLSDKDGSIMGLQQALNQYVNIAKDYVVKDSSVSSLDAILAQLVAEHSRDVYANSALLQELLAHAGLDGFTVHKICLLVETSGFARMLDIDDEQPKQADINAFVVNAQTQTGLNRPEIQRLLRSVLLSVGAVIDIGLTEEFATYEEYGVTTIAYVIPQSLYAKEVAAAANSVRIAEQTGGQISADLHARLEPLVAAGVPKAQYLLGYCMVNGLISGASEESGLKLLKVAADACDTEAAAALGDYYYAKGKSMPELDADSLDEVMSAHINKSDLWTKAFLYYTDYGSAALTAERKLHVADIYNHGVFNRRTISRCILLLVSMLLSLILAPGAPTYAPHYVWGIVCMLVCSALFVLAKVGNSARPYDDVYMLPVFMFAMWTLFMFVRLFFY